MLLQIRGTNLLECRITIHPLLVGTVFTEWSLITCTNERLAEFLILEVFFLSWAKFFQIRYGEKWITSKSGLRCDWTAFFFNTRQASNERASWHLQRSSTLTSQIVVLCEMKKFQSYTELMKQLDYTTGNFVATTIKRVQGIIVNMRYAVKLQVMPAKTEYCRYRFCSFSSFLGRVFGAKKQLRDKGIINSIWRNPCGGPPISLGEMVLLVHFSCALNSFLLVIGNDGISSVTYDYKALVLRFHWCFGFCRHLNWYVMLFYSSVSADKCSKDCSVIHFALMDHDVMFQNELAGEAFLQLCHLPGLRGEQTKNFAGLREITLPLLHPQLMSKLALWY